MSLLKVGRGGAERDLRLIGSLVVAGDVFEIMIQISINFEYL